MAGVLETPPVTHLKSKPRHNCININQSSAIREHGGFPIVVVDLSCSKPYLLGLDFVDSCQPAAKAQHANCCPQ